MTVARSFVVALAWLMLVSVPAVACSKQAADGSRSSDASDPLRVAVASNFAKQLGSIASAFESEVDCKVEISSGSTGKLYAQIQNGAPYDVFLAADERRPKLLEQDGAAEPGSRFAYANGRLALYGSALKHPSDGTQDLEQAEFQHLAIANPKTAPYGAAAKQVLTQLGLWTRLQARIVRGESITQAHQFVASGAAELGFVALASVVDQPEADYWLVPDELHSPIRQDAVLLARKTRHPAAERFFQFLKTEQVKRTIKAAGYGSP